MSTQLPTLNGWKITSAIAQVAVVSAIKTALGFGALAAIFTVLWNLVCLGIGRQGIDFLATLKAFEIIAAILFGCTAVLGSWNAVARFFALKKMVSDAKELQSTYASLLNAPTPAPTAEASPQA